MTKIKFKETVLGTHFYKNCPFKEVDFLKSEHHHDFTITVQTEVNHSNRDMEWIMLRIDLKKFLKLHYPVRDEIIRFAGRSCEQIAFDVESHFGKIHPNYNWKVSVTEDQIYTGGDW